LRVLITAFDAYGDWQENSSWLSLVEMLKKRPDSVELVTRRYSSQQHAMEAALKKDLLSPYEAVLHLGQQPGIAAMRLEAIALNVAGKTDEMGQELQPFVPAGPLAYRSRMPLGRWVDVLRQHGIPAEVSYHAGTCLCNALFYLTHHLLNMHDQPAAVGFVHLPLTTQQATRGLRPLPSMDVERLAQGLRLIIESMPGLQGQLPQSSVR
jgi:pyroglutamyl-peptidase